MKEEDIKFLKIWLRALNELHPEVIGLVNKFCFIFDDRFVSIDQHENVEIGRRKI